ncbi:nuclear transport factor 2 family protein [Myxococcota bacterium]|nr:nuclear transport factor 2 family protein [Myxococcota bacterium]
MSLSLEEVGDRIEIQDLLVRYTEAIDTKDWDLLDQCFLPDADLDYTTSGGIAGAYPEVRAWLAKALAMFPKTIHAISNSTIKLSGDRATGRTLVNNPMVLPKGEGGAFVFTVFAYYIDDFVRTAEGWRIAKRFEQQVLVTGDVPEGLDAGI